MSAKKPSPEKPESSERSDSKDFTPPSEISPEPRSTIERIQKLLHERNRELPSVSAVAALKHDPFRILISTLISLRTKDDVTLAASQRLFEAADTPEEMLKLSQEDIQQLIYPAGFYKTKAQRIREISAILIKVWDGKVPNDRDSLLELPGVGRKTANLTLNLGFGVDAICVDTHVHRISNRLGWAHTKTPDDTELVLEKKLPQEFWIPINELMVAFGQLICTPQSPRCSECPLNADCPRIGVTKSR